MGLATAVVRLKVNKGELKRGAASLTYLVLPHAKNTSSYHGEGDTGGEDDCCG